MESTSENAIPQGTDATVEQQTIPPVVAASVERPHKNKHKKEQNVHLPEIAHQVHATPEWVRHFDQQHNIYYVSNVTGQSTWLRPCCQCHGAADKWCIDCRQSYCEHDFHKKHGKKGEKHRWQWKELPDAVPLQPGDEYCIACVRKAAFKMCLECWEPYCLTCFALVHHVGALKAHKAMPYKRAKTGWITIKNYETRTESYVHGETGETTAERPLELYSEEENIMLENIKAHKVALDAHAALIEKLKAELVIVQKERDRAIVDTSNALNDLRAKAAEKDKADAAAAVKEKKSGKKSQKA